MPRRRTSGRDAEACGEPRAENHHHWGYDKPRWYVRLCLPCHRALDALIAEAARREILRRMFHAEQSESDTNEQSPH
jgi:hypothetical protein